MGVNITLGGGITNKDGDVVDAKYQVFILNNNKNLDKWSDIYSTEDGDYNKNIGDSDLSGQDNTLNISNESNEFALIAVWLDGERNTTNIPTQFAYIFHELSGEDTYIQDIQLNIPNDILCSDWTLPNDGIAGETIIAINNNTNDSTYEANDWTHYLYNKFHNEVIFPFMGPKTVEFDFGEGYSSSNVYTPETSGDLEVKIKVEDYFDILVECSKIIKIYYEIFPHFIYSPDTIITGTEITIEEDVRGHRDQISEIYYEVRTEHIAGYNIKYTPNEFQDGIIQTIQYVTFNNGYEDITLNYIVDIIMENVPPTCNLTILSSPQGEGRYNTQNYVFVHGGVDTDGTIENVKWNIYRNSPDINQEDHYTLYYSTGFQDNLGNWEYNFDELLGEFKVECVVQDNRGGTATCNVSIENTCDASLISYNNVDWSKRIIKHDFDVKVSRFKFETKIYNRKWKIHNYKHSWDIKEIKKKWNIVTNNILWKFVIISQL